jgi:hypothetical protein
MSDEPLIGLTTIPSNSKYNSKSNINKKTPVPKLVIKKLNNELLSNRDDSTNENICDNLSDGELVRDPGDCSSFFTCFLGDFFYV